MARAQKIFSSYFSSSIQLAHGKLKSAEETAVEALSELAAFPTVLATHMIEAYLILVTVFVKLARQESDLFDSAVCEYRF
jgi:hypothetical protein